MITIYDALEKDFTHNGYGVLNVIKAEVMEELNGMYELSLMLYISENNKNLLPYITEFNVIKAPAPSGFQLFRIYNTVKTSEGLITVNARHIFYDGLNNYVKRLYMYSVSADAALKALYANCELAHSFNASSTVEGSCNVELLDINPVYGVLGDLGITSIYGGEIFRDNFWIKHMPSIGEDRGVVISYGKNLTGLDLSVDTSQIVTRIRPIGKRNDDSPLYLPEEYVESDKANLYFMPVYANLSCRDIKVTSNTPISLAYQKMRERAQALLNSNIDLPRANAKINFTLLQDTENYKNISFLEKISLGDTITLRHEALGVNMRAKCIKYLYDCIQKRYLEAEIGAFRDSFAVYAGQEIVKLSGTTYQGVSFSFEDLETRLNNHVHNLTDGTQKISYNNLIDTP